MKGWRADGKMDKAIHISFLTQFSLKENLKGQQVKDKMWNVLKSEWEQVLNTDNYTGGSAVLYNIKLEHRDFLFHVFLLLITNLVPIWLTASTKWEGFMGKRDLMDVSQGHVHLCKWAGPLARKNLYNFVFFFCFFFLLLCF